MRQCENEKILEPHYIHEHHETNTTTYTNTHGLPLSCHGRAVLMLDFWMLGFPLSPCTNTNTNTRMPRPYCACSQVTYEWCHCRCMTRVPRSPCAVQELVAAGAVTGEKMRETRGKAAGSGPPSRGLVGWVSLLGVSTTMPLVAHENRNSHTLTHIENARNSIEQHDTSTNTNTNTNTNTRMPRPYCACSQVTYEWCHCRCVARVPRSPCAVQEMDAAEAAAGGKPRGTRGKAAGDAPLSRRIVGWVSLLGADSTTMPLVDNESRKSHTLTHIVARRGEAVHAASAAHAAPDAPALTPTYQTGGSRCKPMQSDKRAKGGIKIQSTKWEKEGEQRQARQGGSELPPRQLRAKQPDSKQHIADFKNGPYPPQNKNTTHGSGAHLCPSGPRGCVTGPGHDVDCMGHGSGTAQGRASGVSRGPHNRGGRAEGGLSEAPPTAKGPSAEGWRARSSAPRRSLRGWCWAAHPNPEGQVQIFSTLTRGSGEVCRCRKSAPAGDHRAMPTYGSASSKYRHRGNSRSLLLGRYHASGHRPSRFRHPDPPAGRLIILEYYRRFRARLTILNLPRRRGSHGVLIFQIGRRVHAPWVRPYQSRQSLAPIGTFVGTSPPSSECPLFAIPSVLLSPRLLLPLYWVGVLIGRSLGSSTHQHACKGDPSRDRHKSSPSRDRHPRPTLTCPSVWWNLVSYGVHYAGLKVNVDAVMEETGGEAPAVIQ